MSFSEDSYRSTSPLTDSPDLPSMGDAPSFQGSITDIMSPKATVNFDPSALVPSHTMQSSLSPSLETVLALDSSGTPLQRFYGVEKLSNAYRCASTAQPSAPDDMVDVVQAAVDSEDAGGAQCTLK